MKKLLFLTLILCLTVGVYAENPTIVRGSGNVTNQNGRTSGVVVLDLIDSPNLRGTMNFGGFAPTNLPPAILPSSPITLEQLNSRIDSLRQLIGYGATNVNPYSSALSSFHPSIPAPWTNSYVLSDSGGGTNAIGNRFFTNLVTSLQAGIYEHEVFQRVSGPGAGAVIYRSDLATVSTNGSTTNIISIGSYVTPTSVLAPQVSFNNIQTNMFFNPPVLFGVVRTAIRGGGAATLNIHGGTGTPTHIIGPALNGVTKTGISSISSTGSGTSVVNSSTGILKSWIPGANITLTDNGTDITIASSGGGGGSTGIYASASLGFNAQSVIGTNQDQIITVTGVAPGHALQPAWPTNLPSDSIWNVYIFSNNAIAFRRTCLIANSAYTNTFAVYATLTNSLVISTSRPTVEIANVTNQYLPYQTSTKLQWFTTNVNQGGSHLSPEVTNHAIRVLQAGTYRPWLRMVVRCTDGSVTNSEAHYYVNGTIRQNVYLRGLYPYYGDSWYGPTLTLNANDYVQVYVYATANGPYINGTNAAGYVAGANSGAFFGMERVP